jgi:hypothetical protein
MDALFFRLRQMLLAMLMKKLAVTGTIYLPLKKLGFFWPNENAADKPPWAVCGDRSR